MVRTYAFNPSTQITESLPGSKTKRESYPQPINEMAHQKQHQQFDTSPPQLAYVPFPMEMQGHSLDSSFSSSSSASIPSVVEGAWKIFGIRTVTIDGQTYYQPINPEIQRMINRQVENMGIMNKPSNSTSPPQDPCPINEGNHALLATMHLAASQSMDAINHKMQEKHFSEYDPAIRKNAVGLPLIHPGKVALASLVIYKFKHENKKKI